jgi:hypothetical protein
MPGAQVSNVISLAPGNVPGEPDPDIIAVLESLLERARQGHLTGLAYATVALDGAQGTGWSGVAGTRHPLGTAVMMLNHRYAEALLSP